MLLGVARVAHVTRMLRPRFLLHSAGVCSARSSDGPLEQPLWPLWRAATSVGRAAPPAPFWCFGAQVRFRWCHCWVGSAEDAAQSRKKWARNGTGRLPGCQVMPTAPVIRLMILMCHVALRKRRDSYLFSSEMAVLGSVWSLDSRWFLRRVETSNWLTTARHCKALVEHFQQQGICSHTCNAM